MGQVNTTLILPNKFVKKQLPCSVKEKIILSFRKAKIFD